jgi:hypothetical protein
MKREKRAEGGVQTEKKCKMITRDDAAATVEVFLFRLAVNMNKPTYSMGQQRNHWRVKENKRHENEKSVEKERKRECPPLYDHRSMGNNQMIETMHDSPFSFSSFFLLDHCCCRRRRRRFVNKIE